MKLVQEIPEPILFLFIVSIPKKDRSVSCLQLGLES